MTMAEVNKGEGTTCETTDEDPTEDNPSYDDHDYSKFRMVELKEMLRGRGLKVSGRKQDLIERLVTSRVNKS